MEAPAVLRQYFDDAKKSLHACDKVGGDGDNLRFGDVRAVEPSGTQSIFICKYYWSSSIEKIYVS